MKKHIKIMGILNVTPDSYYAPSRYHSGFNLDTGKFRDAALQMVEDGVDIIDLGGCSTRPGSETPVPGEEWRRLEPALKVLRDEVTDVQISIDTFRAFVVERAVDILGKEFIVNDISAGEDDPQMLDLVGQLGLTYIAMHKRGTPQTMQSLCQYDDVTEDVVKYFEEFGEKAARAGITDWWVDPGFGFAKDASQNYKMLKELPKFQKFGRTVLVGISRKSFIYRPLGITPEEALLQTQAMHALAIQGGADVLRVHDVAAAVKTIKMLG